jgi:redox-sensitive bicupin YhaK (pirin superfamily)
VTLEDDTVAAETCVALGASQRQLESYPGREIALGALTVTRVLPVKGKRLIGPWCFLDRYGPLNFTAGKPMDVASHPHIGLQTVTWLLDGEVVHRDSLGYESLLRARGVNVMTSGGGIAHAEHTPTINSGRLNGIQLWVALPDAHRHMAAAFQHLDDVPIGEQRGGVIQVFAGTLGELSSSATYFSDILGADIQLHPRSALTVPLRAGDEHAVIVLDGDCCVEGDRLQERVLYYLGTARTDVTFTSDAGGRLLLLGGPPFPETILMWWNFVARTPQEIADARADWEAHRRFGDVAHYDGPRLDAPSLVRLASPNPAS